MRNSTILSASSTTILAAILNVTEARRDVILAVRTEPAVTLETPPPSWSYFLFDFFFLNDISAIRFRPNSLQNKYVYLSILTTGMDKLQFGLSPPKVVKNMSRAVPKSQMFKVSPAFSE